MFFVCLLTSFVFPRLNFSRHILLDSHDPDLAMAAGASKATGCGLLATLWKAATAEHVCFPVFPPLTFAFAILLLMAFVVVVTM
jgi:hypothetical protein